MTSTMTATERRALAKIIDQRFKVLQAELDTRREQIERETRDRLVAESKAQSRAAERRMAKLAREAERLQEKVRAEVAAIEEELGVVPGEVHTYHEWAEGRKDGKVVQRIKTSRVTPVSLSVINTFAPADLEQRIRDELRQLLHERSQGGRSLDALRLDLQERLLLGEVQSETAKAFLEQVPTVDQLLPAPEQRTIETTAKS